MNHLEQKFIKELLDFFKRQYPKLLRIKIITDCAGTDWDNYLNTKLKSYNCPTGCKVTRNLGNNPGPDLRFTSTMQIKSLLVTLTRYIDLKIINLDNPGGSTLKIAQNIPCDKNSFPLEWNKLSKSLQLKMSADLLVLLTGACPAGTHWIAKNIEHLENMNDMQIIYTHLRDSLISNKKMNGRNKTTSNLGYYQLEWVSKTNKARLCIKRSQLISFVSNHTGQLAKLPTPMTSLFSNVA